MVREATHVLEELQFMLQTNFCIIPSNNFYFILYNYSAYQLTVLKKFRTQIRFYTNIGKRNGKLKGAMEWCETRERKETTGVHF